MGEGETLFHATGVRCRVAARRLREPRFREDTEGQIIRRTPSPGRAFEPGEPGLRTRASGKVEGVGKVAYPEIP